MLSIPHKVFMKTVSRKFFAFDKTMLSTLAGYGYTLKLVVSEKCELQRLTDACSKLLPSIVLHRSQANAFTASLSSEIGKFVPLLEGLASDKEALGLQYIGLSLTSMEKVFLR